MKHIRFSKIGALALALCLCGAVTLFGCGTARAASGGSTGSAAVIADTEESLLDQLFSERDLEQEPDLDQAVTLTVSDGKTLTVTEAGVYLVQGSAREATILVDAPDDAKVQLVLDGVSITNTDFPACCHRLMQQPVAGTGIEPVTFGL